SVRQYAFYRALHVAVLSVLLCAVFVPDTRTVYVVLLLTFLALLELPLAWFETAAHARWSLRLRWLQLIPTALLARVPSSGVRMIEVKPRSAGIGAFKR